MISHLGQTTLVNITDPAALLDALSVNRSVFKEAAIEKIRTHFGTEDAEVFIQGFHWDPFSSINDVKIVYITAISNE